MVNDPEETAYIEQEVGLHIEMITVNSRYAGGIGGKKWGDEYSVYGGDGEKIVSNKPPFTEHAFNFQ